MRIDVAAEEQQLEDEQISSPNRGGAAEPGKDVLTNDELDLKEKKGAEENREREQPDGARSRISTRVVVAGDCRFWAQRSCGLF